MGIMSTGMCMEHNCHMGHTGPICSWKGGCAGLRSQMVTSLHYERPVSKLTAVRCPDS